MATDQVMVSTHTCKLLQWQKNCPVQVIKQMKTNVKQMTELWLITILTFSM